MIPWRRKELKFGECRSQPTSFGDRCESFIVAWLTFVTLCPQPSEPHVLETCCGRDCSAKVSGHLRRSAAFFLCAYLSWLPRRSVERAWSQWRLWMSKACWENASRREEELRAKSMELDICTQKGLQEVRMGTENLKVSFTPATQRFGSIGHCKSILV